MYNNLRFSSNPKEIYQELEKKLFAWENYKWLIKKQRRDKIFKFITLLRF